jgi:hypothetical protein
MNKITLKSKSTRQYLVYALDLATEWNHSVLETYRNIYTGDVMLDYAAVYNERKRENERFADLRKQLLALDLDKS